MKNKKLIILKNQGFCYGVKRAISMLDNKINELTKPICLLGEIVHNKNVTEYFLQKKINILNDTNRIAMALKITNGTAVITAHGVCPNVYQILKQNDINYLDTTCPFVQKTFDIIKKYIKDGFEVIYIGKNNHPETEAALGIGDSVHLVENTLDVDEINLSNSKIVVVSQTTMSLYDIKLIVDKIKNKYKNAEVIKSVCNSTFERQKELTDTIEKCVGSVCVIIIGDNKSNNTEMLRKRVINYDNACAFKIESHGEINLDDIKYFDNIIICSGASTPDSIVHSTIEYITNNIFFADIINN